MIRRLRARLRTRRQRRLVDRFQQLTSGGHVTPADLARLASGGVPAKAFLDATTPEDPR